ncbi:C8orf34 isoform 1 [Pongo abelii]|uniref:C8orf34 isoform 1 n=2 Tax=Pongo abelii TaxID=9601 RepID=H2PQI4_PONAB|nr:C8orf34 isoform 1 [Pongo abelii]
MSSPLASELSELAALRPGFRLSAPHARVAPRAATHARGRGQASHAGQPRLRSSCPGPSPGKRKVVPSGGAQPRVLPALSPRSHLFPMASHPQTRIQAYLEKNKIGPLFEELMTKLITETPDQPIPFLIDHLQSKQGNRGQLQRTLSGSAALWAESEKSESKGTRRDFRSYDKPWQLNAKKPKKSKSDLAVSNISPPSPDSKSLPRSVEHPKWNWRTKPQSRDFDELNHILQESKKLGKALENLSRSIAISDELDKETVTFNSSVLRPRVIGEWIGREENDADPLAAEMLQPPIPRSKNDQWESEDSGSSPAGSLKMEPKNKGLKQQQQQHKKLLAAMLSQDSFESTHSPTPSVTEEDIDNEDDAMELLEDLNDLRMEGVTTLVPSGSKFNQGRPTYPAEPQAKVTLNICSRCARLQGDNLEERTEESLPILHSPDEKIPDSFDSLPGTEEALMEEGDEFEKASKLTGPGEASSGVGHSLKNYMEEDESLKQLQVVHQPWILPSDTESEGVEAEQEKRSADLLLCVPCSSCPTLVYSGL